jgi:hypothetical protein
MIERPDERRHMAKAARAAGEQLPTWADSARRIAATIEALT